jgi:DNA-binding SARP family transcriptional activator
MDPFPLIARPRLLRWLGLALRQGHVLIDAPPGYGKSTLLRTFALNTPHAHYLALTPADTDLAQWQTRVQAWLQPGAIILLDDVHVLNDAPEGVTWLIDQLHASTARFVLSGRQVPSRLEPFAHAYLTTADLAFTPVEVEGLLRDHDRASDWHARTQGWPLALALIARAPIGAAAPDRSHALFEYLVETMLRGLPAELLRYMQITCVPLCFTDELAAALSGETLERVVELRAEVQRRNLFLETTDQPGWFKYHDLIREFLLTTLPDDPGPLFDHAVQWFEARGDQEQAIEHALAGRRYEAAIRLLRQVPVSFVRGQGRFHTFRRWVLSLPEALRDQQPALLVQLGYYLFDVPGRRDEGWAHVQRALAMAEHAGDHLVGLQARTRLGLFQYRSGQYDEALNILQAVLQNDELPAADRRYALRLVCVVLGETNRFREARRAYREAIALAQAAGDVEEELFNRQNLAITVLAPLGEFSEAAEHMQIALDHYRDLPGLRVRCLHMLCDLHLYTGDWDALARAQDEIDALTRTVESVEAGDQTWPPFYRAVVATGRGDLVTARALLEKFNQAATQRTPIVVISAAWLDCWLLRRERRYAEMISRADEVLAGDTPVPFFRAQIALWRDVARWSLAAPDDPPLELHPEVCGFIRWRARAELVFVRAWSMLEAWRRRDGRWLRQARSVLRALERPGYAQLLTQRDPDLGTQFWTLCLIENLALEKAIGALRAIGSIDAAVPLLKHAAGPVRARAAQALAAIGQEAAMIPLTEALSVEQDRGAAQAIEAALMALEQAAPPTLHVTLLGQFSLKRGDQPIGAGDWPRPAVRRLFQYFALQRGRRLTRDRILEDLWPEADPTSARASFKQVFSWLRKVLEPYMRSRAASRYIEVSDDLYCFDPQRTTAVIDVDDFDAIVRPILAEAGQHDVLPLPAALLTALESWQPLLPDLPYDAWTLEPREKVLGRYLEGCLYVARALLDRDRPTDAATWAARAIDHAPWLEEGYQVLMRAQARQGNRSLALKTYDKAVSALHAEMSLAPSALTVWLAQRLQNGEEI